MATPFEHLPPDVAAALDKFDAAIADGTLPLAEDGHPVIPASAEPWLFGHLAAHLPADDFGEGDTDGNLFRPVV